MSNNNEPLTSLRVIGRLGVTFRIMDANLREIAAGVDALELPLPPGLYMIEWQTAGAISESYVRIERDGPSLLEVRFRPDADERSDDQTSETPQLPAGSPRQDLVALIGTELRSPTRPFWSSVAIIVAGDSQISPREALIDARLFDRDEVRLKANRSAAPALVLDHGEYARCYRVRPGRYHLRFRSTTGESLAQSIPVLAGRQTIVFLQAARANLLVASGETFVKEQGVGIDASQTIVITVGGDESALRIRERVRVAGVLLHDLAATTSSLSQDFVRVMGEAETDPLLKLYAATVALTLIEAGRSPLVELATKTELAVDEPSTAGWFAKIASWVPLPKQSGMPVDATIFHWRLRRTAARMGHSAPDTDVLARIEVPPMFERSWRWAISESIDRPQAVPSTPSLLAATRSAGGATPWLCWRAAAAKAAKSTEPRDVPRRLDELIEVTAQQADTLLNQARKPSPDFEGAGIDPLSSLSPELATAALRTSQLAGSATAERGLLERPLGPALQEALALSLSLPAVQLRRRLAHTLESIDALLRSNRSVGDRDRLSGQAPALARRSRFADDPQRGRFGEKPRRDGFSIAARFDPTSSKNWIRITMRVRGRVPDGAEVEFHLHDSFNPPRRVKRFKNHVAELTVTAWGGFTVGVWIPAVGVELELNLATARGAPPIIKTR